MIKWSYRNWPYLINDREGSSAVLNVMSNPRSEKENIFSAMKPFTASIPFLVMITSV